MLFLLPLAIGVASLLAGIWFGSKVSRWAFAASLLFGIGGAALDFPARAHNYGFGLLFCAGSLGLFASAGFSGPAILPGNILGVVVSLLLIAAAGLCGFWLMLAMACAGGHGCV